MQRASSFRVNRGWKMLMMDVGLNPVHVLRAAGLPGDLFAREKASVTPEEYFAILRAMEEQAGVEELPLMIGRALTSEVFDPPIFAAICSPNLSSALQRLAQYKPLVGPITMDVSEDGRETSVALTCYGHQGPLPQSLGAMELVFFTQLARMATRARVVPLSLEMETLPRSLDGYRDYFGRDLKQGPRTRISFSAEDAKRPFLTEDAGMWNFFEEGLKQRLHELSQETTISRRVKSALLELLPGGQSNIESVASRLALSKRSLQRHLSLEQSSYKSILNDTRQELATYYLKQSHIPPAEIGYLLGFQDGNSFQRAFKTWTTQTPSEFRKTQGMSLAG